MAEEKDVHRESLADALMRELRFAGLEKDNLSELVGIVAGIQRGGLKKIRVFPKGIPYPDGLRVFGVLEAGDTSKVLAEILTKTPRLGNMELFPIGIPWPEIFRVNVDIGANVQTGPINRF